MSIEKQIFLAFCFFSFFQLVVPIVIKSIFQDFYFYKLHFIFCIIALIFFLVYIIFLYRQYFFVVSDTFTIRLSYFTNISAIFIWSLIVAIFPTLFILGLCMIVRGIDFFLCSDMFHSFVFFIKKNFLALLKPFKKFIKWILTFCKKGICWLLIQWENLLYSLSKPYKKFSHKLSESDNKLIRYLAKLCKKLISWLQT